MKKHIAFVNVDAATLTYLMDSLQRAPQEAAAAKELLEAVTDLATDNSQTLMLEASETASVTTHAPGEICSGALRIQPQARRVLRGEEEIILTPTEFDILLFLARNRGEVFTKEQIYQAVWQEEYLMDDSNIMAFIRKLRKKIEPHPDAPEYILTIWGIGYKFCDK